MKAIMGINEVKEAIKAMERQRKESIVTNAELSEEAMDWLRSKKYLIKITGDLTAIAKTEEALPTEREFEEVRKEKERREGEARILVGLLELLTISAILDEIFS